jgi:hypothetical protein
MAYFDDIGKKISKTSQDAVKKTKEMAATVKLNSQVLNEERTINTLYIQLGQLYYTKFGMNTDTTPCDSDMKNNAPVLSPEELNNEFTNICFQISEGFERIENIKSEIIRIKNTRLCPKCGNECAADILFCSACGFQLPIIAPQMTTQTVEVKLCPNCGNKFPEDAVFCTGCGRKL